MGERCSTGSPRRTSGRAVDYLSGLAAGRYPHPSHADLLGVRLVAVEAGAVRLAWRPGDGLVNPTGAVHGGFIAGVIDMSAGLSAASDREDFTHHLTLELHVDFLAPVLPGTVCEVVGRALRTGGRTSLAEANVVKDGNILARGRGTFLPQRQ